MTMRDDCVMQQLAKPAVILFADKEAALFTLVCGLMAILSCDPASGALIYVILHAFAVYKTQKDPYFLKVWRASSLKKTTNYHFTKLKRYEV